MKAELYVFRNDTTLASVRCYAKHMIQTNRITVKEVKDLLSGNISKTKDGWYIAI